MMTISKQALQNLLFEAGIDDCDCPAANYGLPRLEWIEGYFFPLLTKNQRDLGLVRYDSTRNTCIRFARNAANLACNTLAASKVPLPEDTQLAVGCFEYVPETGDEGEMICIFVYSTNDGVPQVAYFQPQPPPHITTPIRKENTSCYAIF